MAATDQRLLEMRAITRDFPGVRALDRVDFSLAAGEVHALVGANGAGKSTLIKVLAGVYADFGGTILVDGQPQRISSPRASARLGVAVIHQEFNLVPSLTVGENIMLGREPRRLLFGLPRLDWPALYREAEAVLQTLGFRLSARVRVRELGVAEQQLVQIAKAVAGRARILVMDEPTARLSRAERDDLFVLIGRLKAAGTGIIYISHFLEEVFMIADRVTVLRDGRLVSTRPAAELTRADLVRMMLGHDLAAAGRRTEQPAEEEVLRVEHLSQPGHFTDVSFSLHAGEILGIAGLVGSGRTELARTIFGASSGATAGQLTLAGHRYAPSSPRRAIARRLAFVPEDRKQQGLILVRPVEDNVVLPVTGQLRRGPFLDQAKRRALVQRLVARLSIRFARPSVAAATLSGGNQQKVVLAKWLATSPRLLVLDQPTAGIDVGTKEEIYALLAELAAAQTALLIISDDPEELARLCDRVLIMRRGRVVRELAGRPTAAEVLAGVTADY